MKSFSRLAQIAFGSLLLTVACGDAGKPSASTAPPKPAEAVATATVLTPRQQLLGEGFVVSQQLGKRDPAKHIVGLDILENPATGELAYMASDDAKSAPVLVMKGERVTRQLGETTPSYVGMTQHDLQGAIGNLDKPATGDTGKSSGSRQPEYGTNNYWCCVQTCVNDDLANIGCTGVGNLLPYCTQAAAIFSAGCAFSCINNAVSCSIAPNCGCGPVCGDGICDLANGESCNNCSVDCGACTCVKAPNGTTIGDCSGGCGSCGGCGGCGGGCGGEYEDRAPNLGAGHKATGARAPALRR